MFDVLGSHCLDLVIYIGQKEKEKMKRPRSGKFPSSTIMFFHRSAIADDSRVDTGRN